MKSQRINLPYFIIRLDKYVTLRWISIERNLPSNQYLIKSFMMRITIGFVFIFFTTLSSAQRLILPGDYPDPSVVKIGDTYWASATTSNWFPAYPLLRSKDLVNWT